MSVQHYYDATPATRGEAIAFTDTIDTRLFKALYFGASGTVVLYDINGDTLTVPAVAGSVLPLQNRGVKAATTVTAASVIALYD